MKQVPLTRRRIIQGAALGGLASLGGIRPAGAAPAPAGVDLSGAPVRIIVPFTAGGSSDIIAPFERMPP